MCLMLQNSSHVRYFAIGVIGLSSISIQAHKSLTLQQLTDIFESQMCDRLEIARQHLIDLKITQKLWFPLTYFLFLPFFLALVRNRI